jgi:hypothetical protein
VEPSFSIPASFRPSFTAGGTISRGISTLFERPLLFFGLTLLQFVPMLALYGILFAAIGLDGVKAAAVQGSGYPLWFWALYLPACAAFAVPLSASFHAATEQLAGRQVSFGDAIAVGFRRALPMLGVYLVLSIAVGAGLIALIVPGFIVMTMYIVSMPAIVQERVGVFGALDRAGKLSKGYRPTLFAIGAGYVGITVAVYLGSMLLFFVLGMAVGAVAGETVAVIISVAFAAVLYTGLSALFPVLLSATYVGLREEKEVGTADQVAGVFS